MKIKRFLPDKISDSFIIHLAILFVSLLWIEVVFRLLLQLPFTGAIILRIMLFNLVLSLIVSFILSLLPYKISRIILTVLIIVFAFYATFQLGYRNYMNIFMSVRLIGYGATKVGDYVVDFIKYLKPQYFLTFLPCLSIFAWWRLKVDSLRIQSWKTITIIVLTTALFMLGFNFSLSVESNGSQLTSVREIYQKAEHSEVAISELGLFCYLYRDIVQIFSPEPTLAIVEENPDPEPEPEEVVREFDDSEWIALMNSEENERIKAIDEYLLNRTISQYNDYSGIFEGKNIILFMVEAFDYVAIHEELTPTLYKMFNEGLWFTDFYSPQYSCATAESELIGLTSLIPSSSSCSAHNYAGNDFSQSIFYLFREKGYYSTSYHNWNDEFYPRNRWHESLGSEMYLDVDALKIRLIKGWQSDQVLVEEALPYFADNQPFFSFIITSSMHMPYDVDSNLGKKYLTEVNAVFPNAPAKIKNYLSKSMEYDKALEYLLAELESRGILEDTVIVMYADHHPLKMETQYLIDYSFLTDRSDTFGLQRSPMLIYNSEVAAQKLDEPASTFDILPTLANMFNLNYDPRYYMGTDYFSEERNIVIFSNGSWKTSAGYYEAAKGQYTSFGDSSKDNPEAINQTVKNRIAISLEIFKTDYFKYRKFNKILLEPEVPVIEDETDDGSDE